MIKRKNKIYKGSVANGYVLYKSFMYLKLYELDFHEMVRKFGGTRREKQKRKFRNLLMVRHTISEETMERCSAELAYLMNKKLFEDVERSTGSVEA